MASRIQAKQYGSVISGIAPMMFVSNHHFPRHSHDQFGVGVITCGGQRSYSAVSGTPFILMVEGAQIDKQSHPNQAAGAIWDTIEFDKVVGVGRAWTAKRPGKDTLLGRNRR